MDSQSKPTTLHVWVSAVYESGDVAGTLVTEEGEPLYGHMSSSKGWLMLDLTENFGRKFELIERFGEDFDVVYHESGQVPDWLRQANAKWAEENVTEKEREA